MSGSGAFNARATAAGCEPESFGPQLAAGAPSGAPVDSIANQPDSRWRRKPLEESPGSTGQGAR